MAIFISYFKNKTKLANFVLMFYQFPVFVDFVNISFMRTEIIKIAKFLYYPVVNLVIYRFDINGNMIIVLPETGQNIVKSFLIIIAIL